jgi:antitoxin YefM
MNVTNYSNARKNFKSLIDKVNDDQEAIIITTKKNNAVLISESEYKQYKETIYLLNNPTNAKHLAESIDQLQNGKTIKIDE